MSLRKLIVMITLFFVTGSVWAEVVVGVFPRRPAAKSVKMFTPLVNQLSAQLNEKFKLVVPKDFKTFWRMLKQGKFDVVHYNQYHYVLSNKKYGYRVFVANEEFGKRRISGALTVRKDSGIQSIADLKGKTILFGGGKKAMGSYIAPTALLKQAGLMEGRDYHARFSKNPPSAVLGVYSGAVNASGSGNVILQVKMVTKSIDVSKLRILAESEAFVHLPWAVKADMPAKKLNRIRSVMIGLKGTEKGRKILESAKVTGFYPVADEDFNQVRKISEYALSK